MTEDPTVFIVDDDDEVRSALALLMESVGMPTETFESALVFIQQFNPQRSGCLVLDVRMKGMSGLDLQERLSKEAIYPPIIVITGHGDVPMAVCAVKAGAIDFIEKPFNDQVLLDSIHRAIEQDAQRRGKAMQLAEIESRLERLTPREREILNQVVSGKRNKTIAFDLDISQSTVEAHRSKVMEKMQARSLSDLMRMMLVR